MLTSNVVCEVFDQIEHVSSRIEMVRLLAGIFKNATPREAAVISYLSMGELYPSYVGTQFNIAEKTMIKALAYFFNCAEHQILTDYQKCGDLGLVVANTPWPYQRNDQCLSIIELYNALCALERVHGEGAHEQKIKELVAMFPLGTPLVAKYVVRILLGKLRLGFSDMTIIETLSVMETGDKSIKNKIEHAYNINADIGAIAALCTEQGSAGLSSVHVVPGIPIRPAAAERASSAQAVIDKIGSSVAQPKIDGFRLQVHMKKKGDYYKVRFFSRHLQDMSAMFPDLMVAMSTMSVDTFIGEGEAIGYNSATNSFMPFQETVKRRRKHGIEAAATAFPLQLFMFDMLYLDGRDYMHEPHHVRMEVLATVVAHADTCIIKLIEEVKVTNAQELEAYFLHNIAEGLEGVMVKRDNAPYQPGKRNFNWIKLKRQEEGHVEDTLDLVILGYYFGEGKRSSFGIGAFLVGAYNSHSDMFETIAKIGTGLTDVEWCELSTLCDAIKIDHKMARVMCHKDLYPDVWVVPKIVCLVRADEITLSPVHTCAQTAKQLGFALRFPRFMGYRVDKGPEEATTSSEVKSLFEDQYKK